MFIYKTRKIFLFSIISYLPIQKSLKIFPRTSSTSTSPTTRPRFLVANLKSSAALSNSFIELFSRKFSK